MENINAFVARVRKEEGQTMAEYAVVLGVITVLCFVAFAALSDGIIAKLGEVTGLF